MAEEKKIHFVILSAFGLTSEPVASNRIQGLVKNLSDIGYPVTLVSIEYPGQTPVNYGKKVEVVRLKPLWWQRKLRKFLDKKKGAGKKSATAAPSAGSSTAPGFLLKLKKTVMHLWYSEGYLFPFLRFTFKAFATVRKKLKKDARVAVLASNGPAAAGLSASLIKFLFANKVLLVQDFRDPVFNNDYTKDFVFDKPVYFAERRILKSADLATGVSKGTINRLAERTGKFLVLYNGFNLSKSSEFSRAAKNSILFIGSVYSMRANTLKNLVVALKDVGNLYFEYAGKNSNIVESLFKTHSVERLLINRGFVAKDKAQKLMENAGILLILKSDEDEGVLTGKFFEYVMTDRPILVIGAKDREFNEIAEKIGGVYIVRNEPEAIKEGILYILNNNISSVQRNMEYLMSFHWKNLAKKLADEVESLIQEESTSS